MLLVLRGRAMRVMPNAQLLAGSGRVMEQGPASSRAGPALPAIICPGPDPAIGSSRAARSRIPHSRALAANGPDSPSVWPRHGCLLSLPRLGGELQPAFLNSPFPASLGPCQAMHRPPIAHALIGRCRARPLSI